MKKKIIGIVLTFFVVVSTLLTIFAFRITPVTLKRDTFVYEYGTFNLIKRWNKKGIPSEGSEIKEKVSKTEGIKETEGKLYYELSWEFIEEMAKRMANNKSNKYPLFNWKKNINLIS